MLSAKLAKFTLIPAQLLSTMRTFIKKKMWDQAGERNYGTDYE